MLHQGEVLSGLYQIEEEIGMGGTGMIYRAYHLNLQKEVVVKKIKDHFTGILNVRGEVDILKSLHHTCLPQVYDFLQIGNGVYTVMEYIAGHDMAYYISQATCFDESLLIYWMMQLGGVLSYLHTHGILHLDIKPANIMVTEEGNVCLIDFNISLSGSGEDMAGLTREYASPEQCRKFEGLCNGTKEKDIILDERTDIYSLGVSFYHMMSGFWTSYSKEFVSIVNRMMQQNPKKRYRNADRLLNALSRMQRSRAEKRTLHTVFFGMLGGILALSVLCGVLLYQGLTVTSAEQQSIQRQEIRLEELNHAGEYKTARKEGIQFLNDQDATLRKLSGARAGILEKIVDACIGAEYYEEAGTYLDELMETGEKAEYYQSLSCVAAYTGDYEKAEDAVQQAEALGADESSIQRSRAELAAAQGNYGQACEIYQALANGQDTTVLRRAAYFALRAAVDTDNAYAQDAAGYYSRLAAKGKASFADQMNLVSAYCMCGMEQKALEWLKGMRAVFPGRYEIYLELGVLTYNAQQKLPLASRNFTEAAEYAKEAKRLFLQDYAGEENGQLEELLELLDLS